MRLGDELLVKPLLAPAGFAASDEHNRRAGNASIITALTAPCLSAFVPMIFDGNIESDWMTVPEAPKRKRLNAAQKRALKAASVQLFAKQYARKAQKNVEPNDRRYEREVEQAVKRMKPDELDRLLREDGEE